MNILLTKVDAAGQETQAVINWEPGCSAEIDDSVAMRLTKMTMANGHWLHVRETPEEIFQSTQDKEKQS